MRSKLTLQHTSGKRSYIIVRTMLHDHQPKVGKKGTRYGYKNTTIIAVEGVQ